MHIGSLLQLTLAASATAHQKPLSKSALHDNQYAVYQSLSSSKHTIRIKEQNDSLCDARTRQYTGWLDVGHKHLFFWYFESHYDEKHDPLTLWQTGGPGGSDMTALFMENGPCLIDQQGNGTKHNPYGWSQKSSLLYVDQPAGVGFSYSDKHTHVVSTSSDAAVDLREFLEIFISQVFPHKQHVPFHISGESYSGHYTPYLAAEILRHNALVAAEPPSSAVSIPLKTILMGNPALSFAAIAFGFWETTCTTRPGVSTPIFNDTICDTMAEHLPECMRLMKICDENPDYVICKTASNYCLDKVTGYYEYDTTRNRFDITAPCDVPDICYKEANYIEEYLNKLWVRQALAVPDKVPRFKWASEKVAVAFYGTTDGPLTVNALVAEVLAAGVDVLIYQGKLDAACNTAGNRYWATLFKWPGQAQFSAAEMQPWAVKDGQISTDDSAFIAGEFKEARIRTKPHLKGQGLDNKITRFSFLTHNGAGHMVPHDKPEQSLAMLNAWISGQDFA